MNINERNNLKKIIQNQHANYLSDIKLVPGHTSLILYPTNDLLLTEGQFNVLKKFLERLGETEFCLTQFDGGGLEGLFSDVNTVKKFPLESTYSQYCETNLYSISVLFSINGKWAIIIDETFDWGVGLFVSNKTYVDIFNDLCFDIRTEYKNFMTEQEYNRDKQYYEEQLETHVVNYNSLLKGTSKDCH